MRTAIFLEFSSAEQNMLDLYNLTPVDPYGHRAGYTFKVRDSKGDYYYLVRGVPHTWGDLLRAPPAETGKSYETTAARWFKPGDYY